MSQQNYSAENVSDVGVLPLSAGADLTGTGTSQPVAIGDDVKGVRFFVKTAEARIKFGVESDTVSTSTGIAFPDGMTDVIRKPANATHFHYIGNGATINYVLLG
jgi:hypothetical protein